MASREQATGAIRTRRTRGGPLESTQTRPARSAEGRGARRQAVRSLASTQVAGGMIICATGVAKDHGGPRSITSAPRGRLDGYRSHAGAHEARAGHGRPPEHRWKKQGAWKKKHKSQGGQRASARSDQDPNEGVVSSRVELSTPSG